MNGQALAEKFRQKKIDGGSEEKQQKRPASTSENRAQYKAFENLNVLLVNLAHVLASVSK
jgi:hypothetical protein